MNISKVQGINSDVVKALAVQGSSFEVEDAFDLVSQRTVKPLLLTALLGGVSTQRFGVSDTYVYDSETETSALPSGKQYSGFGATVGVDKAKTLRFGIPSFGIRGNVAPKDYANRRKAGSNELQDEAYVLAKLSKKMGDSWDLFKEQQLLAVLTTDTNDVAGGAFESFNFYDKVVGGNRTVKNIDFSGDAIAELRSEKKALSEAMLRAGEFNKEVVCICGSDFFASRLELERQESNPRELRTTFDFASEEVTGTEMPSDGFRVDNFVGSLDGIRYVEYTAEIGTSKIEANKAFMLPVNADTLIRIAYAPAQTRAYVNTEAQAQYGWSGVDERNGVTLWEESNYLVSNVNPRLIRALTSVN